MLTRDGSEHLAIEVKAAEKYNTAMLKGLRAIASLPGLTRRILVLRGRRSFTTEDGIHVWTFQQLHHALESGRLWE